MSWMNMADLEARSSMWFAGRVMSVNVSICTGRLEQDLKNSNLLQLMLLFRLTTIAHSNKRRYGATE